MLLRHTPLAPDIVMPAAHAIYAAEIHARRADAADWRAADFCAYAAYAATLHI